MGSITRRDVLVGMAFGGAVVGTLAFVLPAPFLGNDSYQYVSVAHNLAAGEGLTTSHVHFDVERARHVLPAPLTTFPPAYPAIVGALAVLGVAPESAGFLLSLASFVALIPLLAWGARLFGMRRTTTLFVLLALVANASSHSYPLSVMTEPLFTALSTAAVLCFVAAEQTHGLRYPALAALLLGLAYWTRYAGLFLFAASISFYGGRVLWRRDRRSLAVLATQAISAAMIGAIFWRNITIAGSWMGGNGKNVVNPAFGVARELLHSAAVLTLGKRGALEGIGVFLLCLAVVVALGYRARNRDRMKRSPLTFPIYWGVVYTLAMIYLGIFSPISFGPRMFYPLLPLTLLAVGAALEHAFHNVSHVPRERLVFQAALGIAALVYVGMNLRSTLAPLPIPHHERIAAKLEQPVGDGQTLRAWIEKSIPARSVIVATNGQATGYAFGRPSVTLVESEYSDETWTPETVRSVMATYAARWLVVYDGAEAKTTKVQQESPFLSGLARGSDPPPWLSLAIRSDDVLIYQAAP